MKKLCYDIGERVVLSDIWWASLDVIVGWPPCLEGKLLLEACTAEAFKPKQHYKHQKP